MLLSADIQLALFLSGSGPVVPAAIWRLRFRPGGAHCDLALAVEEDVEEEEDRRESSDEI